MNAINCCITDTPNLIFVLPTPPLIERIVRRLLEIGFNLQCQTEFIEESIAEMDLKDGGVLVWESASDAAPRNHCDFLCLLDGAGCVYFFSLRLRLSAVLNPDCLSIEQVDVTTTLQTYNPHSEPPYTVETLTMPVTGKTWDKYEADVLMGRLLSRAYG
jgi:hypothetical protein